MKVNWSKYWREYKDHAVQTGRFQASKPQAASAPKPAPIQVQQPKPLSRESPRQINAGIQATRASISSTNAMKDLDINYHKEILGPHKLASYISQRTSIEVERPRLVVQSTPTSIAAKPLNNESLLNPNYVPPKRTNIFTHEIIDD